MADHNYHYYPDMPYDSSAILFEEAGKLGLRFVLCRGGGTLSRLPQTDLPPAGRPETLQGFMDDIARLARDFHDPAPDAMRRVVSAPTTPPHSMHPEELRACAQQARALGLRLHSHLSETVHYQDLVQAKHQMLPVEFCESVGWVGPDVWYAHLVKLDPQEIALLGRTRTGIAHCPQSNCRLGSGIAPCASGSRGRADLHRRGRGGLQRSRRHDLRDPRGLADAARQGRRGGLGRMPRWPGRGAGGGGLDRGRRGALGLGRRRPSHGPGCLGHPGPGQAADIAIYGLDRHPRYFGLHDPAIGPVASGGNADLRWLFVGGQDVVRNGALPGLDLAELGHQAREAVRDLLKRA